MSRSLYSSYNEEKTLSNIDQKSKIGNRKSKFFFIVRCLFSFSIDPGFPPDKIPEKLKMLKLHQKCRELLKKTFFQLRHGLLLVYQTVTPEHRKKDPKGKKRMTTNTNHKYDPYSFILYNLTLFIPMYPSPKTYKNVVNCSKKPFFSYVPVCYEFTRQLPNNAEISAKKGEKMAKKHMKTQKNHPRNKSQIGNRKYSSIRARSRRLVRINAYKKMKAPLETWQASCRNSLNGKDY